MKARQDDTPHLGDEESIILDMSKKKTELTLREVKRFLQEQFAVEVGNVRQLIEGEVSQAFSFECGEIGYVIRIGKAIEGFKKDAYAYNHFRSERLPIPRVIKIGYIDEQHIFCIAEKMPGITLQDVDSEIMEHLLQPTTEVWFALKDCDISSTTGFGDFDADGRGAYGTWQEYLLSILDPHTYSWDRVIHHLDRRLLQELITAFTSLAKHCPEERYLVHGDFGSNNVLTDGRSITAVLDWDDAKYGDPLFDVATAYFWSSWLDCMAAQAAYYKSLSAIPGYQERLACYQLRIGLAEVYDSVIHQNWKMARWAAKRSAEIALFPLSNTSLPL